MLLSLFGDDEKEEIAQARLAMSLAEVTGNPTDLSRASHALGWAPRHRRPDEAIAAFDRCVALARRGAGTRAVALRSPMSAAGRGDRRRRGGENQA